MERCLASWQAFGLTEVRRTLDGQALEVAHRRESSSKRRKDLGQSTRAFKKGSEGEKLLGISSILKAYQEEIDELTKRAKYCEAAFTAVYAGIRDVPDPVPHLLAAVAIEPETARLRTENDELQDAVLRLRLDLKEREEQSSGLKNQDTTVRDLTEKVKALQQQREEEMHNEYKAQQEQRATQEVEELKMNLEASVVQIEDLRQQLLVATATAAHARQEHDASQAHMLERDTHAGELGRAKEAETEFMEGELHQAHARIAGLQRELEHMRAKEVDTPAQYARVESAAVAEMELLMAAKDGEISRLIKSLRETQTELETTREQDGQESASATKQIAMLRSEADNLRQQLRALPSAEAHDRLREQLRIIRRAEGAVEDGDDVGDVDTEGSAAEVLLTRKVRTLGQQIATLNATLLEKDAALERAQKESEALHQAEERQRCSLAMISKLEDDLATASSAAASGARDAEHAAEALPLLSAIMPSITNTQEGHQERSHATGRKSGEGRAGLLPVITAQRDRLKAQVLQLEEQLHSAQQQVLQQRQKLEVVQKDRADLETKLRYVQAYGGPASGSSSATNLGNRTSYGLFRRQQENRRHQSEENSGLLTRSLDRSTHFGVELILRHQFARRTVVVYILVLHLLVWVTIHRLQGCVVKTVDLQLELLNDEEETHAQSLRDDYMGR